jgi:ABC-type dipeptide/oligopeptide/nickel transport system ATPase component
VPEVTREILAHTRRNKLVSPEPDKLEGDEIIMKKLAKMGVLKTARFTEVITITSVRDEVLAHQESAVKYKDKTTPTIEENFDRRTGGRGASLVRLSKSEIKNGAPAPSGAMDISDHRHVALMRKQLQADYGIGRAAIDRAVRKVPRDLSGGQRARALMTMAQAIASKLRIGRQEALEIISKIAAETLLEIA